MTSPSPARQAGTPRWTVETERLVFDAAFPGLPRGMGVSEALRRLRAALTALADAGTLVEPGGETREEWTAGRLMHRTVHTGPWRDANG